MFETKTITDEDIQSLIDGELDNASGDQIFEEILNSPVLFGKLAYYMGQREQLRIWWDAHNREH